MPDVSEILIGSREAYNHLAERYGSLFTRLYRWRTFAKACELCEVPHMHQRGPGHRKAFNAQVVRDWFTSQFTDTTILGDKA